MISRWPVMREMSSCESVLRFAEPPAEALYPERAGNLRLETGSFAGDDVEALQSFDVATRDSPAEGARPGIIHAPGNGRCRQCATTARSSNPAAPAPAATGTGCRSPAAPSFAQQRWR
jgi:Zn finger protein HypA/HybF involved in hydrogenase expression